MTHFTVAIIIPPNEAAPAERFVEQQMQPYDEGIEVAPYVCYSTEQAAADIADTIHRLELIISRDEKGCNLDKCRENLDELRRKSPEEAYRECCGHCDTFNAQGEPISRYNPASKWDWYTIGGRWSGWINDIETKRSGFIHNTATTEQAIIRKKVPHAIVTPDGFWHERGRMGWWAVLTTENEDWDADALRLFARYPDHKVVIIDAHI
jgi:hypothetical protein